MTHFADFGRVLSAVGTTSGSSLWIVMVTVCGLHQETPSSSYWRWLQLAHKYVIGELKGFELTHSC